MSRLRLGLLLLIAPLCAAATLPELFKQAKDEFGRGDYKQSLADFELLDATSRQAGYEADRVKLTPVVTFYRAANLAALGRHEEAKATFITYLALQPNAAIASPPFPKAVVEAFELARKESAGRKTLDAEYLTFIPAPGWTLAADEQWTESPVRYLLSADQKKKYAALTAPADRTTFVEEFWKDLDPTPATPQNEFRREFERRVAFADAHFATTKMAGRASERGATFTFLGPPSYVGVSALASSDETIGALRAGGNSDALGNRAASGGPGLDAESRRDMREVWYYRQNRLPAGVLAKEVRFEFITREGYGSSVMQKNPEPMQALGQAVEAARKAKKLNQ